MKTPRVPKADNIVPTSINKDCKHDYENYIKKGRALFLCPKCNADITLEVVLIAEAKEEDDKISAPLATSPSITSNKDRDIDKEGWICDSCGFVNPPFEKQCVNTENHIPSDWEKEFWKEFNPNNQQFAKTFLSGIPDFIAKQKALSRLEGIEEGKKEGERLEKMNNDINNSKVY